MAGAPSERVSRARAEGPGELLDEAGLGQLHMTHPVYCRSMEVRASRKQGTIESRNPATGELVGTVDLQGPDEVRLAVEAARRSAASWNILPPRQRRHHLVQARSALVRSRDEIADLISRETGKPLQDAYLEVMTACMLLTWSAKSAERVLAPRQVPTGPVFFKRATLLRSPYGVVGVISPWNYPVTVSMQALASVLAAGNVAVLKPSELTPLSGLALARALNTGEHQLVHPVIGDGTTGEALVRSGVDKISFTGSPLTGRRIMAAAADSLTPVVMELGGKDPMIICDDADIRRAARAAAAGAFGNAGQTCIAVERVFATPAAYEPFLEEALRATSKLRQGWGPGHHIGAITRPEQLDVIEQRVRDAESRGARVLVGGQRVEGPGSFFPPTIVADVSPAMAIMREETFGPVLPVMRVETVAEAVRLANDCDFGLNASIFTSDQRVAEDVASRLCTGGVSVNDALLGAMIPSVPFGGEKHSGFGRVYGEEGLLEFSRTKAVIEDRFPFLPSLAGTMIRKRPLSPALLSRAIGIAYTDTWPEKARIIRR